MLAKGAWGRRRSRVKQQLPVLQHAEPRGGSTHLQVRLMMAHTAPSRMRSSLSLHRGEAGKLCCAGFHWLVSCSEATAIAG